MGNSQQHNVSGVGNRAGDSSSHKEDDRSIGDEIEAVAQTMKPKLRGWFHAGTFPFAMAAGLTLVALAPTIPARFACAVFALTSMLLFGTSAAYHRGDWSTRVRTWLRRWDHSNIFLIIAGTYTPLAVMLLPQPQMRILLFVIWISAAAGIVFRIFWVGAPRWLYVPIYVGMGIAGIGYMGDFFRASVPVGILILAGGVCYIAGAVIYGIKRPDPLPKYFGFHEIFHALTVAAFLTHYAGILVAAVTTNPGIHL
ncbi:hemolysin III family protein [Saxibacter everestensis]|uniref:Hemolysin III family protein n=1 Tax=Saxibacter everestensis TaxID=2909229 RepID=A0ABY8QNV9_9MICO|nr:hemolysin III family protein [Brevibacteriaceae bacterium ZFBP1038]